VKCVTAVEIGMGELKWLWKVENLIKEFCNNKPNIFYVAEGNSFPTLT
jgi:hypothetical protein